MLGAAYLAGKGVECDLIEALHWLLRARESGAGELAAGFLREARALTKRSQQAEAERRAALSLDAAAAPIRH
jgi:TPR repeat protein